MLGSFPKIVDKNFVIGFLLPVILGLVALAWLFPGLEILSPLRTVSANETTLGAMTYLILLSYGLAILLMVANTLQYRFLEGYLPPLSRWAWLRKGHQERRQALAAEHAGLITRWKEEKDAFPVADAKWADVLKRRLVDGYPPLDQEVMPTRFGNVMRAFESYPLEAYGADGVPIWLRLAAVIPKDFAAELQDTRAQVNFLLNLLYILAALAFVALWKAIADTPEEALAAVWSGRVGGWHVQAAAAFGLVALALLPGVYLLTVARAQAWGDAVKSAFDCYLPALVTQLGYATPTSADARRALWREINALFIYRQPMNPAHFTIAATPAPAAAQATDAAAPEPRDDD